MAINLTKGERISIDKGLTKIKVGLGWEPNESTGAAFDLDASVFMIDKNRKLPEDSYFIFYNNKYSPDGSVEGADDDRTGESSTTDDEIINIDLSKVAQHIEEIIFIVTIHEAANKKQNFGQVRDSFIRIIDQQKEEEIIKYELDEDFSIETSVEIGRLYRRHGEWKFEAIGKGFNEDLNYFVDKFN